ncbi:MAG: transposase [Chitinophagaceae bacterium]
MINNGDIKRQHTPEFKTQVVLDLLKETDTLPKIASKYGIHPTQARRWRDIAIATLKNVFTGKPPDTIVSEKDKQISELTELIGKKEIELDWVKKKVGLFNH